MDDTIAAETFRRLMEILQQGGLGWVVEQVHETIQVGKPVDRQVRTLVAPADASPQLTILDDPAMVHRSTTGGRTVTFPARDDYSSREQLELLIDAIQRVLVDTTKMEQDIHHRLIHDFAGVEVIRFAEDGTESYREIGGPDLAERTQHVELLKNLLSQLRDLTRVTS